MIHEEATHLIMLMVTPVKGSFDSLRIHTTHRLRTLILAPEILFSMSQFY